MPSIIHTYPHKTISNFTLVTNALDHKSGISKQQIFSNQNYKLILNIKIISYLNCKYHKKNIYKYFLNLIRCDTYKIIFVLNFLYFYFGRRGIINR